jgi:simple sugar transport system substrate-binding protein
MSSTFSLTRRQFVGATGALAAGLPFGASAAADLTVGIVYVGPRDDYGWNQSHAVAARALKAVPGIKVIEEERVPETTAVAKSLSAMIQQDGAKLVFGTSFGYFNPFMVDAAKANPGVQFRHPTTLWTADKHPANLGGYFCYLDQAHHVNGIAAALSTKTDKIGFIAAKPIDLVLRNINAFTLGARRVNPKVQVHLIITGDWSLPVREAEATHALINIGCDVIASHVDSPKVIVQTAEARGAKTLGHNASQAALAPKGFITGAENKYETIYKGYADLLAKGQPLPNISIGGYDKDMVRSTPFGAGATDAARNAALARIAELKSGSPIFTGPIKDNQGKVVLNGTHGLYDPVLESTNYLVEGVVGSTR